MDQFFLTSPERIQTMIDAAGLSADDTVIEVGAGIGSFAVHLPPVKRLDLVELDEELCAVMSARLERADTHIHATDAITYLPAHDGDVIFSNLPYFLTHDLLQVLSQKSFRVAVVCVRQGEDLSSWKEPFSFSFITSLQGPDYSPPQPFTTEVYRVVPRPELRHSTVSHDIR